MDHRECRLQLMQSVLLQDGDVIRPLSAEFFINIRELKKELCQLPSFYDIIAAIYYNLGFIFMGFFC